MGSLGPLLELCGQSWVGIGASVWGASVGRCWSESGSGSDRKAILGRDQAEKCPKPERECDLGRRRYVVRATACPTHLFIRCVFFFFLVSLKDLWTETLT